MTCRPARTLLGAPGHRYERSKDAHDHFEFVPGELGLMVCANLTNQEHKETSRLLLVCFLVDDLNELFSAFGVLG